MGTASLRPVGRRTFLTWSGRGAFAVDVSWPFGCCRCRVWDSAGDHVIAALAQLRHENLDRVAV